MFTTPPEGCTKGNNAWTLLSAPAPAVTGRTVAGAAYEANKRNVLQLGKQRLGQVMVQQQRQEQSEQITH